jgi:hypothetical protein
MTKKSDVAGNNGKSKLRAVDLSELDMLEHGDEPQALELIDPRDNSVVGAKDGKPVTLYVLSFDSETMVRFADDQINKSTKRGKVLTAEEQRERNLTSTARLLMAKSWENVEWAGQPLAHNLVNAKMLMSRLPWARRQVEALASQEAAYLGNSSGRSANSDDTISDSPSGHEGVTSPSENG